MNSSPHPVKQREEEDEKRTAAETAERDQNRSRLPTKMNDD